MRSDFSFNNVVYDPSSIAWSPTTTAVLSDSTFHVLMGVVPVCYDIMTRRKKLTVKINLEC